MSLKSKPGRSPLSLRRWGMVFAVLAVWASAYGTQGCDSEEARIALLSAFPAELAPLIEQSIISSTMELEGRLFRVGWLGPVPVVFGLTGIGMANAALITRAVFERFEVKGVVVSGVAGSSLPIGDVAVPQEWALIDGTTFIVHKEWLELVEEIARAGDVSLEHCSRIPFAPLLEPVCLPHVPSLIVGGIGRSRDPFFNLRFPRLPNLGDVFGCDVVSEDTASGPGVERYRTGTFSMVKRQTPVVNDMETAAIAREAAVHGVPFIAFRAVSDGAGDPLGLPGFPAQFFVYYRLAARNAAAVTVAFLKGTAYCSNEVSLWRSQEDQKDEIWL